MPSASVTKLYAEIAASKTRWANTRDHTQSGRYLASGRVAGDALIETPSRTMEEHALKLTELLDWMADRASPDQLSLLQSCIRDAESLAASSQPADRPNSDVMPVVKIDRRARPTTVDGVLYRSVMDAARANPKYSYSTILKMAAA